MLLRVVLAALLSVAVKTALLLHKLKGYGGYGADGQRGGVPRQDGPGTKNMIGERFERSVFDGLVLVDDGLVHDAWDGSTCFGMVNEKCPPHHHAVWFNHTQHCSCELHVGNEHCSIL